MVQNAPNHIECGDRDCQGKLPVGITAVGKKKNQASRKDQNQQKIMKYVMMFSHFREWRQDRWRSWLPTASGKIKYGPGCDP